MTEMTGRDRRAEQRERYREAIVDAAGELIRERLPVKFTVDDLAERANVSRRTIFNHFSSLDDVIAAACSRELLRAIDVLEGPSGSALQEHRDLSALFDEVASRLRGTAIPDVISFLYQALRTVQEGEAYPRRITQEAATRVSESLVLQAIAIHPAAPLMDIEFLVTTLLNGVSLVSRHWIQQTGAALDPQSRARWDDLLEHMLLMARRGYSAHPDLI